MQEPCYHNKKIHSSKGLAFQQYLCICCANIFVIVILAAFFTSLLTLLLDRLAHKFFVKKPLFVNICHVLSYPLLFLIYMNNLSDKINSIFKIPAENTSFSSPIHDQHFPRNNLNNDLHKMN